MDWLGDHIAGLWLSVAILLGIAEMFSLDLMLLMMSLGALVGASSALLGAGFLISALAAAAASLACLVVLRPSLVRRLHTGATLAQGHDKLLGTQGLVTQQITALESGRVRLSGEIWSAKPYDETLVIGPGETVEVFEIRGATAYVHPVPSIDS